MSQESSYGSMSAEPNQPDVAVCPYLVREKAKIYEGYNKFLNDSEIIEKEGPNVHCIGEPFCSGPQDATGLLGRLIGRNDIQCPDSDIVAMSMLNPDEDMLG